MSSSCYAGSQPAASSAFRSGSIINVYGTVFQSAAVPSERYVYILRSRIFGVERFYSHIGATVIQRSRLPIVSSYGCLLLCLTREIGILVWWWEIRRLPAVERGMHLFTLHKKFERRTPIVCVVHGQEWIEFHKPSGGGCKVAVEQVAGRGAYKTGVGCLLNLVFACAPCRLAINPVGEGICHVAHDPTVNKLLQPRIPVAPRCAVAPLT